MDTVVLTTVYDDMRTSVTELLGDKFANRC